MPEEEGRLGQCRVCNSQQVSIWKTFDNIKEVFKSHIEKTLFVEGHLMSSQRIYKLTPGH